jgi:hypothetical protein
MKKSIISVLVVCLLAFTFSAFGDDLIAEILPSGIEVHYGYGGGTKLEVPTYSDGTTVYVPLKTLIQMLGGIYEEQEGKVTISIDAEALPPLIAQEGSNVISPETSWVYLEYYFENEWGGTVEDYIDKPEIISKIDKAIKQNVDIEELITALEEALTSGGFVTRKLDNLIK